MFPTATKDVTEPAGPPLLRRFIDRFPAKPHLAIGGIGPANIAGLVEAGVQGVAVCAAVCGAERPDEVVATLREAIESAAPVPA